MITKKYLNDFSRKFKRCKDLDFEWSERLFKKSGIDSWGKLLVERSKDQRRSFEVNEENISGLKEIMSRPLTDKEYRLVADAALKIYLDGYDDICVFPIMLEPCIVYFKAIHDLNYLIPLIHAYCFEFEQADAETLGKQICFYEDVFAFKDEYTSITSRYARLSFFKSYSNVISRTLNKEETGCFGKMYALYREALTIWNDEEVQKLDGDDEEFIYFIDRMLFTVTLYEDINALTDREKDVYEDLLEESRKTRGEDEDPMIDSIEWTIRNYKGEIANEELVDRLINSFDDMFARIDIKGDPNEQEDYLDNCYNIIGTLCYYMDGKRYVPTRRDAIIERMKRLRLLVTSLPYTFFSSEMNKYVYMLYQRIHPFLSFEEKKEYLLEVIMYRQPITCIHSLMVESIAEHLGKYLLDRRPDLFVGVIDTKSVREVSEKKTDILEFIRESALYHDVGKVTMVDVINTQNRRLTDVEFQKIKTHPKNGLTILDNDKDFRKFFDIIVGHHRFYDGSAGYPSGFDNTVSHDRIVIDIVTLSDCTDAATDILGRNYARGKTFGTVLEEFIAGAGTRYNPEIVASISGDAELIKELTCLTTEKRMETYKRVYSRYIN